MQEYHVTVSNGRTEWRRNGKLHRIDGPAVELESGTKKWYQNGEVHRTDGPAIEYADGDKHWVLTAYSTELVVQRLNVQTVQ